MSIPEVAAKIAAAYDLSKVESEAVVRCVLTAVVEEALSPEGVSLHGFGTFTVKERRARKGRNPRTGETVDVGPSRKLTFKQAKAIKDHLNTKTKAARKPRATAKAASAAPAAAAKAPRKPRAAAAK